MKKILFVLPIILLIAAGCNKSSTQISSQSSLKTPVTQSTNSTTVQQQSTSSAPNTSNQTVHTYTNQDNKFSFSYPSNFNIYLKPDPNPKKIVLEEIVPTGEAPTMIILFINQTYPSFADTASEIDTLSFNTDGSIKVISADRTNHYSTSGDGSVKEYFGMTKPFTDTHGNTYFWQYNYITAQQANSAQTIIATMKSF